MRSCN